MQSASIYLLRCAIVAALGGLLFGFDTAVISGVEQALQAKYQLSSAWLGFTTSSALIGTVLGSIVAGKPADAWGRRKVLLVIAVLYFISAVGSAYPFDWISLLFFRFIGGIGVGGASVVCPMYIAEISPAEKRGRLVAITQFNIVLGILLAYLSNFLIVYLNEQIGFTTEAWRWMFGVEAIPAIVFFFLLFFTPESPRWLVTQGRIDEARDILSRVNPDANAVEAELSAIQESLHLEQHLVDEPFFRRAYAKPIMLAIAIAAFNQLSGINAILYYTPRIFNMAGAPPDVARWNSVIVGLTNLIFTTLAMMVIDKFGRRRLMLLGSIGYILSLATVAGTFFAYDAEFRNVAQASEAVAETRKQMDSGLAKPDTPAQLEANEAALAQATESVGWGGIIVLGGIMVFIASHGFGQGAVIWVFISEIFPNRVRARGQALGSSTHWIMNALISGTFPLIAESSGGLAFAFYAVMMVGQLVWVLLVMPETKGVPLEQIQKQLGIE